MELEEELRRKIAQIQPLDERAMALAKKDGTCIAHPLHQFRAFGGRDCHHRRRAGKSPGGIKQAVCDGRSAPTTAWWRRA